MRAIPAGGIENRLVPAAGFPLQLARVGALKNVSLMTRLKTAFDLPRAIWDASRMLNEFAPDVVIGVGGYASGPAMLAALVKHIPTLAFEPNVVPGFANRMVAKFVSGAAVHFEETAKYFRHAEVTGVPVRQAFFEIAPKRGGTPTLLVFGGSQGAHAINDAMIRCLPVLPREADDHQRINAEALARHGAAVVVEESKLEGVWLAETIAALLQDPNRLQQMSHAARELAHPNAAHDIAAMAARVAGIEEIE